jgi:GT2 family glycosyltransferase
VGLKNNLEYSKYFYKTFREVYPEEEIVFVSNGSTDGTDEWLDEIKKADRFVRVYHDHRAKSLADTYNKAAELASKQYFAFLHNDIVVAPGFLENIEKHLAPKTAVTFTTVEPPVFTGHSRPGKLIMDFGAGLADFDYLKLKEFIKIEQKENWNKTAPGWFFFMAMNRQEYLELGGMDNLFRPMFCEDDDLCNRLQLSGYRFITSLDALCYHFVSKTSRFSDEFKARTAAIELNSNRNFVRKWGSKNSLTKYNIGFVIKNCREHMLELLEIWCSDIYVDCDTTAYYENEQPNTPFDLKKKLKQLNDPKINDIIVEFDGNKFNRQFYNLIQKLQKIIKETGKTGTVELDILKIKIFNLNTYEQELVKKEWKA